MPLINLAVIALFATIMIIFAVVELRSYGRNYRDFKSIIVSIGLLGTFIGILFGLWDFDTSSIKSSVPVLLEGLKTAFITSVFGMMLSIGLGAYEKFSDTQLATPDAIEKAPLVMVQHLQTLIDHQEALERQMKEQHTQMTALLNNRLESVERSIADGASNAVVEALQKTMSDFNNRLVESFGENFKALEHSVTLMIDWQERYKTSVEQFERTLGHTTEATKTASQELIEVFRTTSTENRASIETLSHSMQQSADKNLETLRASASEVYRNFDELIKVQQHLDTMTQNYARMADMAERFDAMLKKDGTTA